MRLTGPGRWLRDKKLHLLSATLTCVGLPASAIDWDGNFPVDGNYDGKIDDVNNWDPAILPFPTVGVDFNPSATYTVAFGVDVETGGAQISAGDVTFMSLLGSTNPVYAINNNLRVFSTLTLDAVDLTSGSSADLTVLIEDGGTLTANDAVITSPNQINLSNNIDSATLNLNGSMIKDAIGLLASSAGATGARVRLDQGSSIDIVSAPIGNIVRIGSNQGTFGRVDVLDGSTIAADASLFIADLAQAGTPSPLSVLEVSGTGSSFVQAAGRFSFIGSADVSVLNDVGRATVRDLGEIELGGDLTLYKSGVLENLGGILRVKGVATMNGTLTQNNSTAPTGSTSVTNFDDATTFSAGSTINLDGGGLSFNGGLTFDANATLNHTGGNLNLFGPATFNPTEIGFGSAAGLPATWRIRDDVVFAQRLRLGNAAGTLGAIDLEPGGVLRNNAGGGSNDLVVGFDGNGSLSVGGNSLADIYDDLIVGQNAGSASVVTVSGLNALLDVSRNGTGSNAFVGFNGTGVLNLRNRGYMNVGNDLVIQAGTADPAATSLATIGSETTGGDPATLNLTVGNNLLIGPVAQGSATGELVMARNGYAEVAGLTRVRGGGIFTMENNSRLVTNSFTVDAGAQLNLNGGILEIDGGLAEFNHGALRLGSDDVDAPIDNAHLRVANGGVARTAFDIELNDAVEAGSVEVSGLNSRLEQTDINADTRIGAGGTGTLVVLGGASAALGDRLTVGDGLGSIGFVRIDGEDTTAPSFLQLAGGAPSAVMLVGANDATGQVFARNGGVIDAAGDLILGQNSTPAAIEAQILADGTGDANASTISAFRIEAHGPRSFVNADNGGVVGSQSTITLNDAFLRADGGTIITPHLILNTNPDTAVDFINGGALQASQVTGKLVNESGVVRPDTGNGLFSNLTDDLNISGEYVQGDGATLEIQLGGTTAGTDHDRLIADVVTLLTGSVLDVQLINGFTPTLGDQFEIVLANGVLGTFTDTFGLDIGGGLALDLTYLADRIFLEAIAAADLLGDYNDSGQVEQADLDFVLQNWGDTDVSDVTAWVNFPDGNPFDGLVDQNELDGVLLNWGDSTAPDFAASAVPEPAACFLLITTAVGLRPASRRLKRR